MTKAKTLLGAFGAHAFMNNLQVSINIVNQFGANDCAAVLFLKLSSRAASYLADECV